MRAHDGAEGDDRTEFTEHVRQGRSAWPNLPRGPGKRTVTGQVGRETGQSWGTEHSEDTSFSSDLHMPFGTHRAPDV